MPRKPYIPPTIQKVANGLFGKNVATSDGPCDTIDSIPVDYLTSQYGSPLFVFSEETLRQQYRDACRAFSSRYPEVQFAWSYKTNYLKAICNVFHQEGAIAEVVSEFEYEKARAADVAGCDIILNGPCKSRPLLQQAVDDGAQIQLDHFRDIEQLEQIAAVANTTVEVGIRLTIETGLEPAWSKFGFSCESDEAERALQRLADSRHLQLVGLHCHIGTFVLDTNQYRRAVERMAAFAVRATQEFGCTIKYINTGGGFASRSTLHSQYLPGDDVTPSFDDYAKAICGTLLEQLPPRMHRPKLYLETGRALVDQAGYLITTVLDARLKDDDSRAAIVDAGVNLLCTAAWHRFNVWPAQELPGDSDATTIYGPLCMNIDVVCSAAPLPPLSPGDQLVLHPVGAYNITQSMQFIMYRPAVVMLGSDGEVDVIREREQLGHVEALECLPERLQSGNQRMGTTLASSSQ